MFASPEPEGSAETPTEPSGSTAKERLKAPHLEMRCSPPGPEGPMETPVGPSGSTALGVALSSGGRDTCGVRGWFVKSVRHPGGAGSGITGSSGRLKVVPGRSSPGGWSVCTVIIGEFNLADEILDLLLWPLERLATAICKRSRALASRRSAAARASFASRTSTQLSASELELTYPIVALWLLSIS